MSIADGLVELATICLHLGDESTASIAVKEAIQTFHHVRNAERVAQCVCVAAGIARLRGQHEHAARLLAATAEAHDSPKSGGMSFYREYDLLLTALKTEMPPSDFDRAWAAGRQMTLKDAVVEVLNM